MHLLNTSTLKLHVEGEYDADYNPRDPYAILSHKWEEQQPEIIYDHVNAKLNPAGILSGSFEKTHPNSLKKIIGACSRARQLGLKWIWIDTCCINKDDAAGTTEALGSMFQWYNRAKICFAYLADVDWSTKFTPNARMFKSKVSDRVPDNLNSIWFERGWTLQELLASKDMEFYAGDWTLMGTKNSLINILQSVTGIDNKYLANPSILDQATVATRMSWMAGRTTGRVEDIAYSMLGIFGITMDIRYGEGRKAFMRLQKTLIEETTADESIFAWTVPTDNKLTCFDIENWGSSGGWGVLAPSPDCFKNSKDVMTNGKIITRPGRGYFWTEQGIQFEMSVKSGSEATNMFGVPKKEIDAPLNCWATDPATRQVMTVMLHLTKSGNGFERRMGKSLELKKGAKPATTVVFGIDQGVGAIRPVTVSHRYIKNFG